MKLVVPDASVILKWVLPSDDEPDAAAAIRLRDSAAAGKLALQAPSLWVYEVGNILSRNLPAHAFDLLESLISFGIPVGEANERWRARAMALTSEYGVTFYDAAYHALALVERGILVTADTKYFTKSKEAGAVVLLSDLWNG